MRVLLGAFGDPGHAFPVIALSRALHARGHEVVLQTWQRWQDDVEVLGIGFAAAPEYHVFPTLERPMKPYAAAVRAARETAPLVDAFRPDVVVADILTVAMALAGEVAGVPVVTVIPHVDPRPSSGFPPYAIGARLPRTAAGRALWRRFDATIGRGLELGRGQLNEARRRLGLAPLDRVHGGNSERLCIVGTFPQLEYPRASAPASTHVVGPLLWEPPFGEVEPPPGEAPLVLVAPSTSQDREHRLLRAAVAGLAGLDVRVLATWNRRPPETPLAVPGNARLVEWLSYSRTMPRCDVVVCHAGHGTVARALEAGCVVVAVPAGGDMGENAARVDWAGVGVRLPQRLTTPRGVRLATGRALGDEARRARARSLAAWVRANNPALAAAELVEDLAARRR